MILIAALVFSIGQWKVEEETDPISDAREVTATLAGDNAKLVFMCGGGTPMLIYQPEVFLGSAGTRYTQYVLRDFIFRFDDAPAVRESWKYLNDYAASYSQKNAASFVAKLVQAKKLAVRAERYDGSTVTTSYDLEGSAQAMNEAFRRCGINQQ